MKFGVCYYPEHWPEDRWETDAQMMANVGIEVVRIAEFAWAVLEPDAGRYEWSWLDRAINLLGRAGLRVMLGTPTAAPPIWLTRKHPDILRIDANGRRRDHGARRHYCPNSPTYHTYSQEIVSAMAQRYGQHPDVFGWQIDNEWGAGHTARCYCDNCVTAFQEWLSDRYGDISNLNNAWGTLFWSQTYTGWSQIRLPDQSIDKPNPSHALDFFRFSSDSYVAYQRLQIDLVRQYAPTHLVTTNFMGLYRDLDQFNLANDLDFVTWDNYPTGNQDRWRNHMYLENANPSMSDVAFAYDVGDPYISSMAHALTYGLKGRRFWVMEQQAGAINWGSVNPGIRPGTIRLWTWHAVAEGAATVLFFRWRSTQLAQEQYHSGLLNHDGSAGVGLQEVSLLAKDRQMLAEVDQQTNDAEVAILFDFHDLWALEIQPHRIDFGYLKHVFTYYRACKRLGFNVNLLPYRGSLENYKMILVPTLHIVTDELVKRLKQYVLQGGRLYLGIRSGFKTENNLVTGQPLPGMLSSLIGGYVIDWQSLPEQVGWELVTSIPGLEGQAAYWAEVLRPDSKETQILVRYASGPHSGEAAMIEHNMGTGIVYYHGWHPTEVQAQAILKTLADQAGVKRLGDVPLGLIAHRRGDIIILLNFTDNMQTITVQGRPVTVPTRGVKVIDSRSE